MSSSNSKKRAPVMELDVPYTLISARLLAADPAVEGYTKASWVLVRNDLDGRTVRLGLNALGSEPQCRSIKLSHKSQVNLYFSLRDGNPYISLTEDGKGGLSLYNSLVDYRAWVFGDRIQGVPDYLTVRDNVESILVAFGIYPQAVLVRDAKSRWPAYLSGSTRANAPPGCSFRTGDGCWAVVWNPEKEGHRRIHRVYATKSITGRQINALAGLLAQIICGTGADWALVGALFCRQSAHRWLRERCQFSPIDGNPVGVSVTISKAGEGFDLSLLELLKGEAPTSPVPLLVEAHGWTLLNEHLPEAVMQAWNALKNYSGELGAKLLADMFGLCTFNEGSTVQSAVTLTDWPGTTTDSITVRVEDVEALKCDDPRFLLLDELTKRPHVMSMLGLHAKQVAPAIPLQPLLEKVVVGETFQFVLVNGQRVAGRPSEWHKVSMGKIALASAPKVNGSGASIVADDLQVLGFLSNVDGCGFVSADAWGNCAGEYFWIHVPPNTRRNFVMICCDAEGEQSMVVTFTAIAVEEELFFVGWDPDRTFDASIAVVNDRIIDVTVREVIS